MKALSKIKSKVKPKHVDVAPSPTVPTKKMESQSKSNKMRLTTSFHSEAASEHARNSNLTNKGSPQKTNDNLTEKISTSSDSTKNVYRDEESLKLEVENFGEERNAARRGTSFSSSTSLDFFERYCGSFVSIPDDTSDVFDDSQRPSLSSLSLHSSPTPSLCSFDPSAKSDNLEFSTSEQSTSRRRSLSPVMETLPSKHSGSKIWKKIPFHSRVHPVVSKQKSQPSLTNKRKENTTRAKSICTGDLTRTTEMLERLRDAKSALELEVQGKDEELHRLNATIDQVNSTWAAKVDGVMKDLEMEQNRNKRLQMMLIRETEAAKANTPKPAIRIAVPQQKRKDIFDQSPTTSSDNHNLFRDSVSSIRTNNVLTPRAAHKKYFDPNRNKQRGATRPYVKSDDIKKKLFQSLSSSSCMSQLSVDDLHSIAEAMESKRINRGERLMQEGLAGQAFYILADGECTLFKQSQHQAAGELGEIGRPIQQWEIFGDSDVFYNTRRVWSCRCTQPGAVWYITKKDFRSTIMDQDVKRRKALEILEILGKVNIFQKLKPNQFRELATASRVVQFADGDYIIRQGSKTNHVYILKEGKVTTTKLMDGAETRRSLLSAGQVFGISSLTSPSEFNVIAVGKEVVQCIAIPMKHFDQVSDDINAPDDDVTITKVEASLLKRETVNTDGKESISTLSSYTASGSSGYGSEISSERNQKPRKRYRYHESHEQEYTDIANLVKGKTKDDFKEIRTIGHGAYGKVDLCSLHDDDSKSFAIKKLSKYEVVAAEQQKNVFNEKSLQIGASSTCPFIASMYSTFKDSRFVYFVMEFCVGGELFSLLTHANSFDDNMARFYAGCVVEALAFLHSKHIIFRDLKPENVVFDEHGYCKLTDFGFAKKVSINSTMRTYTFCGTPEYMAPEVLQYQAQTFFVDLWALGIFVFEMLTGKAPFKHKNRQALAKAILGGIDHKLEIAQNTNRVGAAAANLIQALCQIRPEDRLGADRNGVSGVARHSWFHKLNWEALRKRTLIPPWKPKVISEQDMRYFSPVSRRTRNWNTSEEFSGWDENF